MNELFSRVLNFVFRNFVLMALVGIAFVGTAAWAGVTAYRQHTTNSRMAQAVPEMNAATDAAFTRSRTDLDQAEGSLHDLSQALDQALVAPSSRAIDAKGYAAEKSRLDSVLADVGSRLNGLDTQESDLIKKYQLRPDARLLDPAEREERTRLLQRQQSDATQVGALGDRIALVSSHRDKLVRAEESAARAQAKQQASRAAQAQADAQQQQATAPTVITEPAPVYYDTYYPGPYYYPYYSGSIWIGGFHGGYYHGGGGYRHGGGGWGRGHR